MRITSILILCVLAIGCQRSTMLSITAESAAGPAADLSQFHTFAVSTETDIAARAAHLSQQISQAITENLLANGYHPAPPASQNPLQAADSDTREELAHLARNAFVSKSLGFNPADPQLLLTLDDLSGPYHYAVPLREMRITNDAAPRDHDNTILADHRSATLPVRAISLAIYDMRKPDSPLWRATAVSLHSDLPLRTLAPHMIRAMLDEFPTPTGQPAHRKILLDSTPHR